MTWARFDDAFYNHPKVVAAGPLAAWLWAASIGYCNQRLTDGYVAAVMVPTLAMTTPAAAAKLAARLVEVRLWEAVEGGFQVHDFLDWNPTAADVRAKRQAAADRVAKHRERKKPADAPAGNAPDAADGNADVTRYNGVGNADVTPPPARAFSPSPSPSPSHPEEEKPPPAGALARDTRGPEPGVGPPPPPEAPPARPADPAEGSRGKLPEVACPTVESPNAPKGDELVFALRQGSGGKLGRMAGADMLNALARVARTASPPLGVADFETLGRAFAAGAVLAWRRGGPPDLGWLLRNDGEQLFAAMGDALAWAEREARARTAPPRSPADPAPPKPREPTPEERAAGAAQLRLIRTELAKALAVGGGRRG